MTPLRIAEIYGGGDGGGAARYMGDVLPLLGQRDEVQLFSLGRDHLEPAGVPVHRSGTRGTLRGLRSFRPDVLHTHGLRANLLGRLYGRLRGVAVVTTVHSFLAQDYPTPEQAGTALLLDGATLQLSTRLIAVSGAIAQDLLARGALAGQVAVVPNGIDPSPPDRAALPALVPGRPLLCIAARLQPAKGVDVAVEALGLLPEAQLAVLGEGPQLGDLERLAASLGCSGRLHFLGYRADFPRIVAGADLLLVPSRAEGFGLSALEAMAQGVPVVASAVGALPELVGPGGVSCRPGDPADLARAVREALARREDLAEAARERARGYTLAATAERTRAVLCDAKEAMP